MHTLTLACTHIHSHVHTYTRMHVYICSSTHNKLFSQAHTGNRPFSPIQGHKARWLLQASHPHPCIHVYEITTWDLHVHTAMWVFTAIFTLTEDANTHLFTPITTVSHPSTQAYTGRHLSPRLVPKGPSQLLIHCMWKARPVVTFLSSWIQTQGPPPKKKPSPIPAPGL